MKQTDLAKAAKISVPYISNLERDISSNTRSGKPRASIAVCERLADALNIDIDEVRIAAGYAPEITSRRTAKESLALIEKLVPGFEGALTAEGMDDEVAARLLDDFRTLAEMHRIRAQKS